MENDCFVPNNFISQLVAVLIAITREVCLVTFICSVLSDIGVKTEEAIINRDASDEEKARRALDRVTEKWTAKYSNSMKRWYDNWDAITPILSSHRMSERLFTRQMLSKV